MQPEGEVWCFLSCRHQDGNPTLASDLPGTGYKGHVDEVVYEKRLMVSNDPFGSMIAICVALGIADCGHSRRPFTWDYLFSRKP